MKRNSTFSGRFALTGVAAAALWLAAVNAHALGLGRLSVQSALGEALRLRAGTVVEEALDERLRPYSLRIELLQADLERLGQRLALDSPGALERERTITGSISGMLRYIETF